MIHELFDFIRNDSTPRAKIDVFAGETAHVVPRSVYGNFLEQLGFAVYGGVWAQLLSNPVFEVQHNLKETDLAKLLRDGELLTKMGVLGSIPPDAPDHWQPGVKATGFGIAILDNELDKGIPLPWAAEQSGQGGVYRAAGRLGFGVRLHPNEGTATIRQGVFLPTHRVHAYEGAVWVRCEGKADDVQLSVGIRRRLNSAEELVWVKLHGLTGEWLRIPFAFELSESSVVDFEPVDFFVKAEGTADVLIDRVHLFPADHVDGFDPEVIDAARKWSVPILRVPGGNFVSGYHWRHGVGDLSERPTRPNYAWGGLDYNEVGTDELLRFCELIGAEPHLCVNMGTGTAEEAAAWVEYCNGSSDTPMGRLRAENGHPEPYGVTLWEVGNEIYGLWQIGSCGSDENARRYDLFSKAMKAVDPNISLLATGNHFDFLEPALHLDYICADQRWHQALVDRCGSELEMIALHSLADHNRDMEDFTDEEVYSALMAQPLKWEREYIPDLLEQLNPQGGGKVTLAITEWGILGDSAQRPRVHNYGSVPYVGFFLNFMIRNAPHVPLANATAFMHGGCMRKIGGKVCFDAQYYAIQLYSSMRGNRAIKCRYEGPGYDTLGCQIAPNIRDVPYADVAACLSDDGRELDVLLATRYLEDELQIELNLRGFEADEAEVAIMTSEDPLAVANPLDPEAFAPTVKTLAFLDGRGELTLPPHSLIRIHLKRRG